MASILFSFVGNQDPFGSITGEGSIVTLLRGLKGRNIKISRAILLYTQGERGTEKNAFDTKEHIESDADLKNIPISIYPVSEKLSTDPTDLSTAIDDAKSGLNRLNTYLKPGDFIEFNASSGTPAMKATFSVFQAANYAMNSRVWQVRNPDTKNPEQERVFKSDLRGLRREFDFTVLCKLINEYNYSAALEIIKISSIDLDSSLLNKIFACNLWNQGQFEQFYEQIKCYLKPIQKNQAENIYWWKAYEQAYTAVIRLEQGHTTEAMLHSYRAVEGLIYEWIKNELQNYIIDNKNEYALLEKEILDKYPFEDLKDLFKEYDKRNTGKIEIRRKVQATLIRHIILSNRNNADFNGWDNKEAMKLRDFLSHKLGGISQNDLFNAWCQYKYNKSTEKWESQNDIYNPKQWKQRLLNCLNLITNQNFDSFESASLFSFVHEEVKKQLENHQFQ